jgi:hypothetical protein
MLPTSCTSSSCHMAPNSMTSSMSASSRSIGRLLLKVQVAFHLSAMGGHAWSPQQFPNAALPQAAVNSSCAGQVSRPRTRHGCHLMNSAPHIQHSSSRMSCVSKEGEMSCGANGISGVGRNRGSPRRRQTNSIYISKFVRKVIN